MSFSGGVYTLPGPALNAGEVVSATENNTFRNDVATAFNLTMLRNGTSTATANLPMGGYKLTGLAAGSANGDSVRYEQFGAPPAIGNTTPNTGKFTTVEVTTNVKFPDASTQTTAATGFGFKNRIINGAMMISQRGTSFSALGYTLDRWQIQGSGTAPITAQVAGPTGFKNALQITGAVGNTLTALAQRIESYNCSDLSGAPVTIQVNIAVSTPQTISWNLAYANAQDNFSANTVITSGTWSATSTATTFTATVTNLPAGAVNGLQLGILANNGGAFTSGTLTITGVQLEKGSTATSFDYRPYGTELALCQRYYYRINGAQGGYYPMVSGAYESATNCASGFVSLPSTMRASPSLQDYSAANTFLVQGGSNLTPSAVSQGATTPTNAFVNFQISGGTAGQGAGVFSSNTYAAYLGFSAEL